MADDAAQAEEQPAQPAGEAAGENEGGEQQRPDAQERLGRQYVNLRREKKKLDEQRAAWKKEMDAGKAELGKLAQLRQQAPENIGSWLQAGNISPQALNAFLTQNTQRANDPYEQRLREETRGFHEKLASYEQQLQEMKNAQARGQNIDKINRIVEAKPDDFELIRHYDAQPDVADLMDLYFDQTGEKITEVEACAKIERYLEGRDAETVNRALAARKNAKRLGRLQPGESDDDAESQPGDTPPAQQRSQPTRGKPKLTNASPSSGRRKPEVKPSADPYDNKWERFKASKTKRG